MNVYNSSRFDISHGCLVPTTTVNNELTPKEEGYEKQKKLIEMYQNLIQNHPNIAFIPPRNDLKVIESTPVKTEFELVALIENISESEAQKILGK